MAQIYFARARRNKAIEDFDTLIKPRHLGGTVQWLCSCRAFCKSEMWPGGWRHPLSVNAMWRIRAGGKVIHVVVAGGRRRDRMNDISSVEIVGSCSMWRCIWLCVHLSLTVVSQPRVRVLVGHRIRATKRGRVGVRCEVVEQLCTNRTLKSAAHL